MATNRFAMRTLTSVVCVLALACSLSPSRSSSHQSRAVATELRASSAISSCRHCASRFELLMLQSLSASSTSLVLLFDTIWSWEDSALQLHCKSKGGCLDGGVGQERILRNKTPYLSIHYSKAFLTPCQAIEYLARNELWKSLQISSVLPCISCKHSLLCTARILYDLGVNVLGVWRPTTSCLIKLISSLIR